MQTIKILLNWLKYQALFWGTMWFCYFGGVFSRNWVRHVRGLIHNQDDFFSMKMFVLMIPLTVFFLFLYGGFLGCIFFRKTFIREMLATPARIAKNIFYAIFRKHNLKTAFLLIDQNLVEGHWLPDFQYSTIDGFPWSKFTIYCGQRMKGVIDDPGFYKIMDLPLPPKAKLGEMGGLNPTNVLIAKHTNKEAYLSVVNTKTILAQNNNNEAYLEYIEPLVEFVKECEEHFWTIIIKTIENDYEFQYDENRNKIHMSKVRGLDR